MNMHNERQIKRTRKPHQCHGCLKIVPAGSSALYCSGKFYGDFYTYYLCENCQAYTAEHGWNDILDDDNGFAEGAVAEARAERERERGAAS